MTTGTSHHVGATHWIVGLLILLVVVLVACFAIPAWRRRDRFSLVRTQEVWSGVDGLPYRVHLTHGNSDQAADTMAELNARVTALLRALRAKYLRGAAGPLNPSRMEATRRLLGRYNPDNLAENSPRDPDGDTSYTIGKGEVLALCLREKGPGLRGGATTPAGRQHRIHDLETLTFVTFHELTHIAIEELDHPRKFWAAFKFILQDAVEAGLLRGVDYERQPSVYCGMTIDYNPLWDRGLAPLV